MLAVDPSAPQYLKTLAAGIDGELTRLRIPQQPTRTVTYASVAKLPAAAQWPNCIATCLDVGAGVKALVWSNGTSWFPISVGAAL